MQIRGFETSALLSSPSAAMTCVVDVPAWHRLTSVANQGEVERTSVIVSACYIWRTVAYRMSCSASSLRSRGRTIIGVGVKSSKKREHGFNAQGIRKLIMSFIMSVHYEFIMSV